MKKFTFLLVALFATMFVSAQEVVLDFTTNTWDLPVGSANGLTATNSYTSGDYTIALTGGGSDKYYFNDAGFLMLGKNGAKLELPAFSFDVEKIEVVGRTGASASTKMNIYVSEAAVSTETTGSANTNVYEIAEASQAAGNIYTLKITSGHNAQITAIKIYKILPSVSQVAAPVVLYNGNDVTGTEVNVEGFTASLTLSCATEGATIRYNDYGGVASYDQSVTNGQHVHDNYVAGDVTLYFKAFKTGLDASDEVSVTFHFTEVINPEDRVATPVISPEETSIIGASVEVSITCATDDSDIFYTLDGSDPTGRSLFYSQPFTLTETTTVKAKAMNQLAGLEPSLVAEKTYTFTSGLNNVKELAFITYSENGNLNIVAKNGKTVEVMTVTGQLLAAKNTIEGITVIGNLPLNQVLIVKVGNDAARVIVR